MKNPVNNRGFALIYAVMIVALVSITIVAMTNFALIDIRQANKSLSAIGAYQAAQSALDAGWAEYQIGNRYCTTSTPPASKLSGLNSQIVNGTDVQKYDIEVCDTYLKVTGYYYFKGSRDSFGNSVINLKAEISGGNITKVYQTNGT